jgi:hypothetical protein
LTKLKTLVKILLNEESKGLWANIQAKKKERGEPAKKGDKDYPDKNNGII